MADLLAELVRDARIFMWVTGVVVLLVSISAPIRTKWVELEPSPLQRAALLVWCESLRVWVLFLAAGPSRDQGLEMVEKIRVEFSG